MDILYVCNKRMRRSVMIEAIFTQICSIDNINRPVRNISLFIKKIIRLNNNVLLIDNIRKIIAFK
ncbi:hypothetical protein [Clostridium psychrophilum]|uniref:hypothetical protein n=1 Tax=Clostridium psychrophilum TaxID=132926 RepID=UPI001C0BD9D3|nr:hypothetical protein [Clostridium psychrophilum]MBU3179868.1 hypothetical protein [Clostridium psychrophilum]